jgi:vacuolar-type H+-ATPase subunit H
MTRRVVRDQGVEQMSEVGGSGGRSRRGSKAGQAPEKAKEAAQQVQEKAQPAVDQAREKTQELRGQAGGRLREQVDTRSTQAGEQVTSMADAMRRTGEQLRSDGKEGPAKVTDQAAERAERLGGYLRDSDADQILGDVERFARRQPWAVAAGGVVLGFIASRFLKASSSRRYQASAGERPGEFPYRTSSPSYEYGSYEPALPGDELGASPRVPTAAGVPEATVPSGEPKLQP